MHRYSLGRIFRRLKKSLVPVQAKGTTRQDGSFLKSKQIGVYEVPSSRELQFFVQSLTADHPSQDRIVV